MPALPVQSHEDVAAFFDASAAGYAEQHGDAEALLRYRLDLLRAAARLRPEDTVLEIGCGNGLHLLALVGEIERGIGIDLSSAMIDAARRRAAEVLGGDRASFAVGAAEDLESVDDASVDAVLCVGSLEHMLDPVAVLRSARRVLKPGGRLACLTLNGGALWYRWVAPACGIEMRQLETDHYPTCAELARMADEAGFRDITIDSWTFVQRGDMPPAFAWLFERLDGLGRRLGLRVLRGGLRLSAAR